MPVGKYTKRPVTIEAIQWDGTAAGAGEIIQWIIDNHYEAQYREINETVDRKNAQIKIYTLEGPIFASPEDWVIRGVQGEFYPCKPDIFYATYDLPKETKPEIVNSFNNGD